MAKPFKGPIFKLGRNEVKQPTKQKQSTNRGDGDQPNAEPSKSAGFKELLNISKVAPAPSRDYFNLRVTTNEISLTHWMISHHRLSTPLETKMTLQEIHTNVPARTDISRVFGKSFVEYLERLSKGEMDRFDELPVDILTNIFYRLGVKEVCKASSVSKFFQKICTNDELWKKFYYEYADLPEGVEVEGCEFGWKTLFFLHHLNEKICPGSSGVLAAMPRKNELFDSELKRIQMSRKNASVGDTISNLKDLTRLTKAKRNELNRKYDMFDKKSGTKVEPRTTVDNSKEQVPLRRYTISSKTKEILRKQRHY